MINMSEFCNIFFLQNIPEYGSVIELIPQMSDLESNLIYGSNVCNNDIFKKWFDRVWQICSLAQEIYLPTCTKEKYGDQFLFMDSSYEN